MPRARDQVRRVEVEEEDGVQDADGTMAQPLQFDEPITWRSGKPIPVSELLRRLKILSLELTGIDQDNADRATLVPKAQELASVQLLDHRDGGVKAHTMQCIVEMFRLLAPNAPYKGGQLKQIFTLFISTIIPALANPSDPYNQQNMAVLNSLTYVKSIALVTDLPGSDHMILNLFTNCFDVMSGNAKSSTVEKLPKNLEYYLASMLATMVDECDALPSGVVDVLLAQFLRADPNLLPASSKKGGTQPEQVLTEVSPAYNMARSICNTCADRMYRYIGQYFSSVLIDASEAVSGAGIPKIRGKKRTHDESEDESDDGLLAAPAEDDLREVRKAHRLLRELWRSCPDVVQNVMPQMDAELEGENSHLRVMAVEAIGDMVAGIGAAGPPPATFLDPAAYPPQSLEVNGSSPDYENVLLMPRAPLAFSSVYPHTWQLFFSRHRDKTWQVRSAWTIAAGRIIVTSGGGKGLDSDQESQLLRHLSDLLLDHDDRVRLAAIQAIATFDYAAIIQKIGSLGGVNTPNSILHNLADRIKDRKHHVRVVATELLGRIWGVAAGAIAEGSDRVRELVGGIPSKILEAIYINDRDVSALVQRVLFDSLLPIAFPPTKSKSGVAGDVQRVEDSQITTNTISDPDSIRAERILVLVRDLEDKAKKVFFNLQQKQSQDAKYLEAYMKAAEDSHAGGEEKDKSAKKRLDALIGALSKQTPEPAVASANLEKFAKHHDRRSYQLIRFCYSADSDYRKIFKAMKELNKRMEDTPSSMAGVLDTLQPFVRSAAILVYNRSHVPAIVEMSRTNEKELGAAAHEVLREISTKAPDIFRVHLNELCETLKKQSPSGKAPSDLNVVDTLKACSGFARRFPDGMPNDRDFYKALVAFATQGTMPKASKHAVTVIISSAGKKEMYIKEIRKACIKEFEYGAEGFLAKLAAIGQLRLLASKECEDETDSIMSIAIGQVLEQVRTVSDSDDPDWPEQIDDDLSAKIWALRILVNGLRGFRPGSDSVNPVEETKEAAESVYKLLNTLIQQDGELSAGDSTPKHHKALLRLTAATQLLKLSCSRSFDQFLSHQDFNRLSKIAQDPIPEVRAGFVKALKKHLSSGKLPNRFYGLVFLYAFEPTKDIIEPTTAWLRSRATMHAKMGDTTMEAVFARFLSLLAHHQDFSSDTEELKDFVTYIMFYLKNTATESNLPMIYHIAQRLKSVQDAIDVEKSENLYILSDLAEAMIRQFQEVQGWSLQLLSGRLGLPSGLFARLPTHEAAQEIADKRFLPEGLADDLEILVRSSMKTKKRKAEGSSGQAVKKAKSTTNGTASKRPPVRKTTPADPSNAASKRAKTPKIKKLKDEIPSSERRKSARASGVPNYAESDMSDDGEELDQLQDEDEASKQIVESYTPPTSDPTPPPEPTKKPVRGRRTEKAPVQTSSQPEKKSRQQTTRGGRVTGAKRKKDIMDIPSDDDDA